MKKQWFLSLGLVGITLGLDAGTKMEWNEVPEIVRQKIQQHAGSAQIEDIDRDTEHGKTTYEAAYKKDGKHVELLLSEDGKVLNESGNLKAFSARHDRTKIGFLLPLQNKTSIHWDTLPAPVKKAAVNQSRGGQIKENFKGTLNNEIVYQVEYTKDGHNNAVRMNERGEVYRVRQDKLVSTDFIVPLSDAKQVDWGQLPDPVQKTISAQNAEVGSVFQGVVNKENLYEVSLNREGKSGAMRIRPDGTVFKQSGAAFSGAAAKQGQNPAVQKLPQVETHTTARFPTTGSGKVTMSSVPAAAQKTIQSHAGANQVEDIDRKVENGIVYYEAAFKKNGVHHEILVAENGMLAKRTANGSIVTEPAGAQSKVWSEGNGKTTFEELPAAVQKTIRAQAGSVQIEDIDRVTRDGRTTFEAGFKKNGKHTELKVAEDGSVMSTQ